MAQKLELTWVGKDKKIDIEPRILIENKDLSNTSKDENTENMIIHGDNLLALKALEKKYAGRVKCIYIDPPFNTGEAFDNYDDNLEHSIWLDLMYKRVKFLHGLLSDNGGILAVELDDNEMPYLRVVLDEIFGRNKFIAQINVRSNSISGMKTTHKEKTILRNKDNLILYKKSDSVSIVPQYVRKDEWDPHYNSVLLFDEHQQPYFKRLKDVLIEEGILNEGETIKEDALNIDGFREYVLSNKDKIYQTVGSIRQDKKQESLNNPNKLISWVDKGITYYAWNGRRLSFLSSVVKNIEGKEEFAQLLGDLWIDIDFQNTQNEGGVSFPAGKKPEALVKRVLDMFTNSNDLVLDSFLGSGTTAAVAHKMGRRYIGIEMGEHAYTHCKVRLDKVVEGSDEGGITKDVNWQGGGGYRFYELAPTLINKDAFGEPIINHEYNAEMLAAAVALHEGFTYQPDGEVFWKQAKGAEKSYLFVTTKHVTSNFVAGIADTMAEDEFLVIACKSFDANAARGQSRIKVKKIPNMLLDRCEFDRDNYNLNIVNPPVYEDDEGEDDDE